jgi:hypothetical protein
VIEEHQATIRDLRQKVRQAEADRADAMFVFEELTALCDNYEVNRLKVIPVAILRHLRPKSHGVFGGQPRTTAPEGDEDA